MSQSATENLIERFLLVTGLPRSGTTVLAAVVEAHPRVELFFEPYNTSRNQSKPPPEPTTIDEFRRMMSQFYQLPPKRDAVATGLKETTTLQNAGLLIGGLLDKMSKQAPVVILWTVRNPVHAFLSHLDGSRKWWGKPDAAFTRVAFERFVSNSLRSVDTLTEIYRRYGGAVLSYESLVAAPEKVLPTLTRLIGLEFDPTQLTYYERGPQRRKVMGDVGVATNPQPVQAGSIELREQEAVQYSDEIELVWQNPHHARLLQFWHGVHDSGVSFDLPMQAR